MHKIVVIFDSETLRNDTGGDKKHKQLLEWLIVKFSMHMQILVCHGDLQDQSRMYLAIIINSYACLIYTAIRDNYKVLATPILLKFSFLGPKACVVNWLQ